MSSKIKSGQSRIGFFFPVPSSKCLDALWPKRQLDLLVQGALPLHNFRAAGGGEAFSKSYSHPTWRRRHQLLNGKEDSCQQEGGGARKQISQHNSHEENKTKRSVSYRGHLP